MDTNVRSSPFTRRRRAGALAGALALTTLLAACGQAATDADESAADGAGDAGASTDTESGGAQGDTQGDTGQDAPQPSGPVIDSTCPQDLTIADLVQAVSYPAYDVDGDGADDQIAIGQVKGGEPACFGALVVETADGVAAYALPDLAIVPLASMVPGGAAEVGGETVIAAPISYSPRGGGLIGLWTMVDGELVQVKRANGQAWSIVATIDDGGGIPQTIDCAGDALVWRSRTMGQLPRDEAYERFGAFLLDGATLRPAPPGTADRGSVQLPQQGLTIFEHC